MIIIILHCCMVIQNSIVNYRFCKSWKYLSKSTFQVEKPNFPAPPYQLWFLIFSLKSNQTQSNALVHETQKLYRKDQKNLTCWYMKPKIKCGRIFSFFFFLYYLYLKNFNLIFVCFFSSFGNNPNLIIRNYVMTWPVHEMNSLLPRKSLILLYR